MNARAEQKVKSLANILAGLIVIDPVWDREISGVKIDSRAVQPGDLFMAYPGKVSDGRDYITQAIDNGATAVVAEAHASTAVADQSGVPIFPIENVNEQASKIAARYYNNPSRKMTVIGVTGTNGKTSCSQYIARALNQPEHPCAVIGTLGYGLPEQMQSSTLTTPDAVSIQSLLADLTAQGTQCVTIEASSHALMQARVKCVEFDIGVFTNLTREHLDYHGSMHAYGAAKQRLFSQFGLKHAVINYDDAFGRKILAELPKSIHATTYSQSSHDADVYVTHLQCSLEGIVASVKTPWGKMTLHSPILGRFNIENLLATLSVLNLLDIPFEEAIKRIEQLGGVPGRMQPIRAKDQPLVIVDYAHTPEAMRHVLATLRELVEGRLWCIFGCGGDRDAGKRPLMGHIAEQLADQVMLTNDNPRHEDPEHIITDILRGVNNPSAMMVEYDRAVAITDAIAQADSDDIILVAGKGHEAHQLMGDKCLPFDDATVVKEFFKI